MDGMSVGIIGAGWMAQEHRRVLGTLDGVTIEAVCDVDPGRAEELARGPGTRGTGARIYRDWRDLLDREELGALVVAVPPLAHLDPTVEALARGIPVYLEKPIARTLEDAQAIVAEAGRTGTVCAVGYQWHALDIVGDLRALLEGDQIGLLVGTSIGPTQSRPWFLDRQAGGGNLLERGSHHLDLVRAIGGEVVSAQAAGGHVRLARSAGPDAKDGDIDDAVTILLEMASGALATVVVAWTRPGQPGSYGLDIVAADSTLRLNLDPDFTITGLSHGQPVTRRASAPPLERSLARFLDAVRQHDPSAVPCTPPDAAATLAVAIAAERALETACSVPVPVP